MKTVEFEVWLRTVAERLRVRTAAPSLDGYDLVDGLVAAADVLEGKPGPFVDDDASYRSSKSRVRLAEYLPAKFSLRRSELVAALVRKAGGRVELSDSEAVTAFGLSLVQRTKPEGGVVLETFRNVKPYPDTEREKAYPVVCAVQDVLDSAGHPARSDDLEVGLAARVCSLRDERDAALERNRVLEEAYASSVRDREKLRRERDEMERERPAEALGKMLADAKPKDGEHLYSAMARLAGVLMEIGQEMVVRIRRFDEREKAS